MLIMNGEAQGNERDKKIVVLQSETGSTWTRSGRVINNPKYIED